MEDEEDRDQFGSTINTRNSEVVFHPQIRDSEVNFVTSGDVSSKRSGSVNILSSIDRNLRFGQIFAEEAEKQIIMPNQISSVSDVHKLALQRKMVD